MTPCRSTSPSGCPGRTARALLGLRFEALRRGAAEWVVSVRDDAGVSEFAHPDAECAYALALLSLT